MVVFSFVNSGDGGYCIASDRATKWRGLPYDLESEMKGVKQKGEEVKTVSVGRNGDWFLRTNTRYACKTEHSRAGWISNVERFAQLAKKTGLNLADYVIQFFTFVPDSTGYVTVLEKTDGSLTRCSWHNVPQKLDKLLEREGPKGVRHVTVGVNGSYVVIMNSGVVWWFSVPVQLKQLLEDAEKRRHSVATVSLSLISPGRYFAEFADGSTKFLLPEDWHNSVNSCTVPALRVQVTGPKMTTSHNSAAPSRSLSYSQPTQSGSSGPVKSSTAGPVDSSGGSGAHSRSHSYPQHAQIGSSGPANPVSSGPVDSYGGPGAHSRSHSYPQHAQFGSSNPVSTSSANPISPISPTNPVSFGHVSSYGGGSGAHSHPQHAQFGTSIPVSTSPASPVSSDPVNSYGRGSGTHSIYPQHAQFGSSGPVGTNPASTTNPVSSGPSYSSGSGMQSHPQHAQFGSSGPVSSGPVDSYGGSGAHSRSHSYPQAAQFGSSGPVGTNPASPTNSVSSGPVSSYSSGSGMHSHPQHAQFGPSDPVSTGPVSPVNSYGDGANSEYIPLTSRWSNLHHTLAFMPPQPVYNTSSLYNGPMPQPQPQPQQQRQEPQQQQQRGFNMQRVGGMLALAGGAIKLARAVNSDSDSDPGIGFSSDFNF